MPDTVPQPDAAAMAMPGRETRESLPGYLERYYWWAYLRPASIRVFDHRWVVSAILWGQYRRLCDATLAEIAAGTDVLQLAAVYGDLSPRLARKIGPSGRLEIVEIAPIQAANSNAKLADMPWAGARVADAAARSGTTHDTVLAFFLLHELPDDRKVRVVDAALAQTGPGGRAIFVDYARPSRWHPVRPVTAAVFALLEPFARILWRREIASFATDPAEFDWSRRAFFGGLYQQTIATRRRDRDPPANGIDPRIPAERETRT